MKGKKPFDFWIFITVLILLSLGLVMVLSASMPAAYSYIGNTYYYFEKQLIFAVIGFVAMFVAMNIDYRKLKKLSTITLILSIVLLILVLVPGIGNVENGSRRWIYLGPSGFQPSELAKFAIILFFSYSLSKRKDKLQSFTKGLLPYLFIIGIYAVLLMCEPHFSCTIIITLVATIILFAAGAKIRHFAALVIPAAGGVTLAVLFIPYIQDRVLSFLNPFKDPLGEGYQTIQSLYAIGSGGIFGRGLGRSMQKFLYLPFAHNDYIFAVLAEELGYVGVIAVILLFLIFTWRGLKVAMSACDAFGSLLATGITCLISVQSLLNIAVVTNSAPPTGVSLPFFSFGGTSLVVFMTEVGLLLSISRYANYERI